MSNHNNINWYINNYNECQTTTDSLLDEYLLKDKSEQSDAVSSYPQKCLITCDVKMKEAVKGSNDIYVSNDGMVFLDFLEAIHTAEKRQEELDAYFKFFYKPTGLFCEQRQQLGDKLLKGQNRLSSSFGDCKQQQPWWLFGHSWCLCCFWMLMKFVLVKRRWIKDTFKRWSYVRSTTQQQHLYPVTSGFGCILGKNLNNFNQIVFGIIYFQKKQSVEKPKGPLRHSGLNYSQLNSNRDIGNLLVHQMKEKQKCGQCDIMRIPKQINKITRLAVISKIYYWSPGFPKRNHSPNKNASNITLCFSLMSSLSHCSLMHHFNWFLRIVGSRLHSKGLKYLSSPPFYAYIMIHPCVSLEYDMFLGKKKQELCQNNDVS
ncbi:hypothetical protein LXL04_034285 [Taraxacum kok-saghyz]